MYENTFHIEILSQREYILYRDTCESISSVRVSLCERYSHTRDTHRMYENTFYIEILSQREYILYRDTLTAIYDVQHILYREYILYRVTLTARIPLPQV